MSQQTAVLIVGRTIIDYTMCGLTVPAADIRLTCLGCRKEILVSPDGYAAAQKRTAGIPGAWLASLCSRCAMKGCPPGKTHLELTTRGAHLLEKSDIAKQFVSAFAAKVGEPKEMTPLLPPPLPGACQECGIKHEPDQPHDAMRLQYQYDFYGKHGRWPTWNDALAHCSDEVKEDWFKELTEMGQPLS